MNLENYYQVGIIHGFAPFLDAYIKLKEKETGKIKVLRALVLNGLSAYPKDEILSDIIQFTEHRPHQIREFVTNLMLGLKSIESGPNQLILIKDEDEVIHLVYTDEDMSDTSTYWNRRRTVKELDTPEKLRQFFVNEPFVVINSEIPEVLSRLSRLMNFYPILQYLKMDYDQIILNADKTEFDAYDLVIEHRIFERLWSNTDYEVSNLRQLKTMLLYKDSLGFIEENWSKLQEVKNVL